MIGFGARILIIIVTLVVALALIAGTVLLQINLSKRKGKWYGLVLPGITFGLSLITTLGLVMFSVVGATNTATLLMADTNVVAHYIGEEGEVHVRAEQGAQNDAWVSVPRADGGTDFVQYVYFGAGAVINSAILYFIVMNIPTAILLLIYAVCRGKGPRRQLPALDKMSVQDLG